MKLLFIYVPTKVRGGVDVVADAFFNFFKESNYEIDIYTFNKEVIFGIKPRNAFPLRIGRFEMYKRGLTSVLAGRHYDEYDLLVNVTYDALIGRADIGYVHFPFPLAYKEEPTYSGIKGVYSLLWNFAFKLPFSRAKIILTNSVYTSSLMRKLGLKSEVLYPPVKVGFVNVNHKEDLIVMLGRISKEKRWESCFEIVKRVKEVKRAEAILIGFPQDKEYKNKLDMLSEGKVNLIEDADERQKEEILKRAKVILHCHPSEHFGIAIAEAMSYGVVPVVPKFGGQWIDLAQEGASGLGFESSEEGVKEVVKLLTDDYVFKLYSKRAMERAREFSYDNFKIRLNKYVKKAIELRNNRFKKA